MTTIEFLLSAPQLNWRPFITMLLITGTLHGRVSAAGPSLENSRVISRAIELLDLPREEAKKEFPIRLRGVITCFDQLARLCFVYDGTASIYVYTTSSVELAPGDLVDITGASGAGLFSPIAQRAVIKVVGHTNLPPARRLTIDQLASGAEDCQFVELEGTVHSEFTVDQNRYIKLAEGNSTLPVCLLHYGASAPPLLDTKLRIQGVAAAQYNKSDQRVGVQLFVPSPAQVRVLEPGIAEPFQEPVRIARRLSEYSRVGRTEHRVHLRGQVTYPVRDKVLYLRDAGGSVRIETEQTNPVVQVGDLVDCAGFVAPSLFAQVITDAIFKIATHGAAVSAIPLSFAQAVSGKFDSELVSLRARLVEIDPISETQSGLLLESDQRIFRGYLPVPKHLLAFSNGSLLSVAGICRIPPASSAATEPFSLLLRNRSDVTVLELPPWWRNRITNGIFAGVLLAGFAGMLGLFHAYRNPGKKELAAEIASRQQVEEALRMREQQLKASIEERERIARDLHDGLIQSIYAIGLNIEDCNCSVPANAPQIRSRLGKIKDDLNCVIEEARNFILGIESRTVTGSEFKTALKSIVLTIAESQPGKVRIDVDRRAAEELAPEQATQLLHVAREAMTNSLRHANAELIVFSLLRHGAHIRFEVKDNGRGFNVNLPAPRGLGLRNMAARAAEMGAAYTLVSEPDQGTRIMLDFDPQNGFSSSL